MVNVGKVTASHSAALTETDCVNPWMVVLGNNQQTRHLKVQGTT